MFCKYHILLSLLLLLLSLLSLLLSLLLYYYLILLRMWGGTPLMGKALKAGQSWPQRPTFASFIESLNLFRELTFSCMIDGPVQILKGMIENFRCHVVAGAFCPPSLWAGGEKVFSIHFPFWNHRSLSNNIENRNIEFSYLNPFKSTVLYNRHLRK